MTTRNTMRLLYTALGVAVGIIVILTALILTGTFDKKTAAEIAVQACQEATDKQLGKPDAGFYFTGTQENSENIRVTGDIYTPDGAHTYNCSYANGQAEIKID